MCGIAGIVGLPYNEYIANDMLLTMSRRGPDDHDWIGFSNCALLHSRLAIIDPVNGKQPMSIQWCEENYTIVYNGELYNTEEVRRELQQSGHSFTGRTDTEVVLHAYAQWKEKALDKLNGIFAFAIWEEHMRRLFIARDRIGVKPFFYKVHNGGLIFASEIKTILRYPTVKACINAESVAELLLLGPGRTPGSGVFVGIAELKPGCYATYDLNKLSTHCYWKLTDREHTENFDETVEHVRYLVTDSIKRQMISDVGIGTFLSGGLDSSVISAVCARELRNRGEQMKTYSVDYLDNDRYFEPGKFQPNTDGHYIKLMSEFIDSDHHWSVFTPDELVGELENVTVARDLPGMADVDFSLLAFCRVVRKTSKVVLSGECADEIFGGYPWYSDPDVRSMNGFPWAQNTKQRMAFLSKDISERIDGEEFVNERYRTTVMECDILPHNNSDERRMKEMVNLNHYWFMQTLLDRKDRMSMYCGLEVRVPFCDYRIAEYLYGIPWEIKHYQGREKGLLRYAMQGIVPDEVLYRKKSPYPKTYHPRYMDLVKSKLRNVLQDPYSPILSIVQRSALEGLLDAKFVWPWYGQLMGVPQTIAYMLQINYWLSAYNISIV